MYLQLFQDTMGSILLTNNILLDTIILIIASKIVHSVVYSFVGGLYRDSLISGSFAGKLLYMLGWMICLIPSFLILFIIGKIFVFINWLF